MDELRFTDSDGLEVFFRRWLPGGDVRATLLVVHGASEHSGRYGRLADALTAHGYAVYAHDQRGHGHTAESTGPGRTGPRGFDGVVDDVGQLRTRAAADVPDRPVVVLGHSMGSVVVQAYVEREGSGLAGYVLSGTMGAMEGVDELAAGVRAAADGGMADEPIDVLGAFNEAFEPARTPNDWLSRDPVEVDKYTADPWCGSNLALTYGFVAEMLETMATAMAPAAVGRVPKDVPVLLMTGEEDPVSNRAAQARALEKHLRDAGLDVTAHYYPGARHEVFNETNRDEVTTDLVEWLDGRTG